MQTAETVTKANSTSGRTDRTFTMERLATRDAARRILRQITPPVRRRLTLCVTCLIVALCLAYVPQHEGLSNPGYNSLFILLFCAGLWVTEAIPAFAVSLLAIGLQIALLGRTENGEADWEKYVATWGSPLIWLFFGGFILAAAANKTGLDQWMATQTLRRLGNRPAIVLLGIMAATAVLSMFLSNTATATMMVAMLTPVLWTDEEHRSRAKAMLLGVAMAANIGGMGTIIGTPPNAIAAGAMGETQEINFAEWMLFGIPPAIVLLAIAWSYLLAFYVGRGAFDKNPSFALSSGRGSANVPMLQLVLVVVTFFVTVGMWMASPLHGIPTTVVSFIPICVLTATSTLDADDVKGISWDVLLLIAGGLSLGVGINDSGLADWLVAQLPIKGLGFVAIAVVMAYAATVLSNLMSNTAAANVIIPIALALFGADHAEFVIPIALAASAAMCLPVSTPPNAIVYGTRQLEAKDLLKAGLMIGIIAPVVVVMWTLLVVKLGWLGN